MNNDIRNLKMILRNEMRSAAASLSKTYCEAADRQIVHNLLALAEYQRAHTVFCFVGVDYEINTKPFLQQVLEDGKILAVPLCTGPRMMEARRIHSLNELKHGYCNLLEPGPDSEQVPMEDIDFSVIPCLCADYQGNRLGHGGGYYDAMSAKYPEIPAALICRERLIVEHIPAEPFDRAYHLIVSENGVFKA